MINKVVLVGRMTRDPEIRSTSSGVPMCNFTIAVARRYGGEEKQTDFIRCVAWRNTAEFISRHFFKGMAIGVVGSLQTRSWEDKDGNKRQVMEVVVDEASFVEKKGGGENPNNGNSAGHDFTGYGTSDPQMGDGDDLPF